MTHAVEQLRETLRLESQGYLVDMERVINRTITTPTGVEHTISRIVDIASSDFVQTVHNEIKTGLDVRSALNLDQLKDDAILSIMDGVRNVWRLTNIEINDQTRGQIESRMETLANEMVRMGFSEQQIQEAFQKFNIEDAAGRAFTPALEFVFGENGPVAKVALEQASGSPDFNPAMEVIFGSSGKIADAATQVASETNLDPALQNVSEKIEQAARHATDGADLNSAMQGLEQDVEQGVSQALDEAGNAAAEHAKQSIGSRIAAGATALGSILTSIPQMYQAVNKLGEAWNRPLRSTEDYMNLFQAAGAAIMQGTQLFQALAGVTQIASAAQAVFNAVMAMNPIVLVVIAVLALIAGLALLIVYWDQVRAFLRDNPWVSVIVALTGIIGLIVLIIAYWDEIKLAVLRAANFISIQAQRIAQHFSGLSNFIVEVWNFIITSVKNVATAIMSVFIQVGAGIKSFFRSIIDWVLEQYNALAESAIGQLAGMERVVDDALGPTEGITGGLESQIAAQEEVVRHAHAEDEERRRKAAETPSAPADLRAVAGLPQGGFAPPSLSAGAISGAAGAADQSITIQGGITVNINAERLEADAAQILSDEIIRAISERLSALRSEQSFRTGTRAAAPA